MLIGWVAAYARYTHAERSKFYGDDLGFEVLYEFRNHDGFDAVMGHKPVSAVNPHRDGERVAVYVNSSVATPAAPEPARSAVKR